MATQDSMRWVWRAGAGGAVVIGWMFILFHNNFHVTPPVVFIMLGFAAAIAAVYALFKMGASTVDPETEETGWVLAASARGELEREKRTLLKAIKEAEFDFAMGKLSKRDVDEMVRVYRLRAIEVIKLLEGGVAETPRQQIEREVRARLEVEAVRAKVERVHADLSQRKNKKKAAAAAKAAARAAAQAGASPQLAAAMAANAAAATDAEPDDDLDRAEAKLEDTEQAKADETAGKAVETTEASVEAASKVDDATAKLDEKTASADPADAVEPPPEKRAAGSKEATP